jgi:hypothetical protein
MLAPGVAASHGGVDLREDWEHFVIATNGKLRQFSIVLFGMALLLSAGGQFAVAQTADVALTTDIVENFVASYTEVRAKADELSTQYNVPDGGAAGQAWALWAGVGAAKSELDATVDAHEFADFNAWLEALSAIARAYAFAKEGGALDNEMAAALEKIRNDPNLPAAQKDMMLQQLEASAGAIAGMRPSQENIDAVTPYVDQLALVFDGK